MFRGEKQRFSDQQLYPRSGISGFGKIEVKDSDLREISGLAMVVLLGTAVSTKRKIIEREKRRWKWFHGMMMLWHFIFRDSDKRS